MGILQSIFSYRALSIFLSLGTAAKSILIILFLLSIYSWAIMIIKAISLSRVKRECSHFLRLFSHHERLADFVKLNLKFKHSPLPELLAKGVKEFESLTMILQQGSLRRIEDISPLLENVTQAMERQETEEISKLEKYIPVLATVSGVSPFLGLLGTVWGITKSFFDIRTLGSTSIGVIAPGMSDALITTIVGLLVAIPALIGYNYFANRVKNLSTLMDNFISEVTSDFRKELLL